MPWASSPSKRGTRDQQTRLRGLAGQKGYEAVHAHRNRWVHGHYSAEAVERRKAIALILDQARALTAPDPDGMPLARLLVTC